MDLFAPLRLIPLGALLLLAAPAGAADESSPTAAADPLQYVASSAHDWQLDSLANFRHLQQLCDTNLRHAEQELAAYARATAKPGEAPFTLQKLLQGENVNLDLTRPYQVHMDAAAILPSGSGAGDANGTGPGADFMRATSFYLRQKMSSPSPGGSLPLWLTLEAAQADFGIIASATNDPTGQQRAMGHTQDMLRNSTAQLSWPFVVQLSKQVQVVYARGARPGSGGFQPPPTPAEIPGAPGRTGVSGKLVRLAFQADRVNSLLAGDGRAGRSLFWTPVGTAAAAAVTGESGSAPHAADQALARLEATFEGGLTMTINARSLLIELAWNTATGQTEFRWAGAGRVHLQLAGLPQKTNAAATAFTEQWELTADAFSLISLPAGAKATPQIPEGTSGSSIRAAGVAEAVEHGTRPTALPQGDTPTILMTVDGRARLVQRAQPTPGPGAELAPPETLLLTCLFNRGLFELGRAARLPAKSTPATAAAPAAEADALPTLQRAWLDMNPPSEATEPVRQAVDVDPAFYQPHKRTDLDRLAPEIRWVGRMPPDWPLPAVIAFGPKLAVALDPQPAGAAPANGGQPPKGTSIAQVWAGRIAWEQGATGFLAWAVSTAPNCTTWQDGGRRVEAEALQLQDGALTLLGQRRMIESGAER